MFLFALQPKFNYDVVLTAADMLVCCRLQSEFGQIFIWLLFMYFWLQFALMFPVRI